MDKMMDKTKCLPLSRWVRHAGRGLILASPMYCGAVLAAETPPAAKDSHAGHHQHAGLSRQFERGLIMAPRRRPLMLSSCNRNSRTRPENRRQ